MGIDAEHIAAESGAQPPRLYRPAAAGVHLVVNRGRDAVGVLVDQGGRVVAYGAGDELLGVFRTRDEARAAVLDQAPPPASGGARHGR